MARASPIQASFNAGELGPELEGRVDIGKYASACHRMENFIPLVQGPARRRGGTKFVNEIKSSAARAWLARFEFNTEQAYVLEFGNLYVRFYTDNGALLEATQNVADISAASPGVLEYAGADPANGDWMYLSGIGGTTELNGRYVIVANVNAGANTFELTDLNGDDISTVAMGAYTSGGTMARVYTLTTPYTTANLINVDGSFGLSMVQSGDVLYICHPDYAPRKLSRVSATSWTIAEVDIEGGPFEDYDPDETVTVYASAATGSGVTLTASSASFASTDVGRLIYLEQKKANAIEAWEVDVAVATNDLRRSDGKTYKALNNATTGTVRPTHSVGAEYDGDGKVQWEFQDPGYGWAEITAYTSTTVVTATVLSRLPDQVVLVGNATTRWALGAWGSVPGYPSHVAFFRNRLTFARATDRKVWFSVIEDYENFRDRDTGGEVTADMGVTITVDSAESNPIEWMIPAEVMVVGTAAGEFTISEQTDSDPFGPANVKCVEASSFGSRGVNPVRAAESILFVQRSGRKLREISYDALSDGYKSLDMTVLAPHMVPKGVSIAQMAYQKEPHSIVWVARSDGALRAFTFNREQYAEPPYGGWHRHTIGGSGIVESVVCVPSPSNDRDDLWMIVRRTIDGVTKRYVEYMQAEHEDGDDQEDSFYVDSGLTYDGAAADEISGLEHLEGATVDVLADGATHPQVVVTGGSVTLDREASVVHVGLPCPAKIATMRIEAGAQDGTAQGKTKRITRVAIRFLDTLGGYMGPTETEIDEILFRSGADDMDAPPPLFSGDKEILWRGGYEKEGRLWYVNDQPLPATIIAVMPQVTTSDRG